MEQNNNRKFDICLANPPYASNGATDNNKTIHLDMTKKCIEISDKVICIFPFDFVTKIEHKRYNKFKPEFNKTLLSIEEIDSKNFDINIEGGKGSLGIYYFDNNKNSDKIKIIYKDKEPEEIDSLLDVSNYTSYEKEILEYLDSYKPIGILKIGHVFLKAGYNKDDVLKALKENCLKYKDKIESYDNIYSLVSVAVMKQYSANIFSRYTGNILHNYQEIEDFILERKTTNGYNFLFFKSEEAAENAREAFKRPLLRFTILREQGQKRHLFPVSFKHIPRIDWEDERIKTDVGLLELCGCPKEKAEEYALYCKKIIEQVDNK